GLVAGAISMGAGEFVSVSSQRDSEKSLVSRHRHHVTTVHDDSDFDELVSIYIAKGISKKTARAMVTELENNQKLNIEIFKELGVDPDDLVNPWQATIASATSFTFGASIPLLAAYLSPITLIMPITFGAVLASLILTGTISARIGKANRTRASLRIILWGVGAMIITYVIGLIFHTI
ncbi:VIT1/CCC1 transporter family protein, partial [Candidatus Saccharibacteria bacterium]|nr:VIT1/CCC1 transporter family protein [Candidatus Saccharibacteria bacterium]